MLFLAVACGKGWIPWWGIVPVAYVFGAWGVMARFVMLHELVHKAVVKTSLAWRARLMRICDLPSLSIDNYFYYRWGHIDHHRNLGRGSLESALQSTGPVDFDLFYHIETMRIRRVLGDEEPVRPPYFVKPWPLNALVISTLWALYNLRNILFLPWLVIRGHPMFPNRPAEVHNDVRIQAALVLIQVVLFWLFVGWKALLFLYLAELFFYFPLHPYFAFFMSTHPSHVVGETCQPTTSVHAGAWYSIYTLCINHHTEHHDFPEVPWFRLPMLRQLGGADYNSGARRAIIPTIITALKDPPVYGCSGFTVAEMDQPAE